MTPMILQDKGFLGVAHLTLTSSTPAIEFAVVLKAMGIYLVHRSNRKRDSRAMDG